MAETSWLQDIGATGAGGWLGPAIGVGATLLGSYMSSKAKSEAAGQQADNYDKWVAQLKPTGDEMQTMRERGSAKIRQNFLASGKQLSSNLASRGLGGGVLATAHGDNTRKLDAEFGNLEGQIQLAGLGQNASQPAPVQLGTSSYFLSELGDLAQFSGGMAMRNWLSPAEKSA